MCKLFYITHPQVVIDHDKSIDEWEISEKGWLAANRLFKLNFWNQVDVIYSSTEQKARKLAEKTEEKLSLPVWTSKDLTELNRSSTGVLPLDQYMEAVKFTYDNPDESYKGWETLDSSYKRNTEAVQEILIKHPKQNIAIFGHGQAGSLIKCWLKEIKPRFDEDPQTTGCYWIADLSDRTIIKDWTKY